MSVETKIYNDDNGLSSYANYTHKDSRGIIWVGTQYGLYRFDGSDFVFFNEKNGLPFRQIMEIYEDSEGWFWLYKSCVRKPNCERDLAFFHPLTKEILTFQQRFGNQTAIKAKQIESIGQDSTTIYFTAGHNFLSWSSDKGFSETPIKGLNHTPKVWTKINDHTFGIYYTKEINTDPLIKQEQLFHAAIDRNGNLIHNPQPFPLKGFHDNNLARIRRKAFEFERLRYLDIEMYFDINGIIQTDTLPYTINANLDLTSIKDYN